MMKFFKKLKICYNFMFKSKPLFYIKFTGAIFVYDKSSAAIETSNFSQGKTWIDHCHFHATTPLLLDNDLCEKCCQWMLNSFGNFHYIKFDEAYFDKIEALKPE